MKKLNIKKHLKNILSEKRYEHTIAVAETSVKLAKIYGEDINKIEIAALLHDCAKNLKLSEMKRLIGRESELTKVEYNLPEILHGFAGAIYARNIFKIEDKDILNAIKYHTIGRKNMTMIEKIIYIADVIEPGRKCGNVDKVRKLAYKDIDCAILQEMKNKINYLLSTNRVIHTNTIDMRNSILLKKRNGKKDENISC
ncbi:bis(5'-nucleosyl)-tetraphosphatase (symmetrical) YqeK [Haliovirga abyssi]|uniref:bis(5'-nucleosyl)-tetraphosphatase (symmetrical) n=1 Tax=Haliovirga abyssi TaxID=2996794 RepID=A0AAU9D2I8_9FUSO|nr:bis(5'-nucleosyl)-tetraphosphatase (symmetrical) YqeK [Haliovirga abyssi]BDU50209.1 phosphohydrolase [Haliovirga abyssi]